MAIHAHQAAVIEFRARFPALARHFESQRIAARAACGAAGDACPPALLCPTPTSNTGVNELSQTQGGAS